MDECAYSNFRDVEHQDGNHLGVVPDYFHWATFEDNVATSQTGCTFVFSGSLYIWHFCV